MDLVLYLLVPLLIEIPTTTFDFLACCRFYGRFVTFQILTVASPPALATLPPSTQLMPLTPSLWALAALILLPWFFFSRHQTNTLVSKLPLAAYAPESSHAMHVTRAVWADHLSATVSQEPVL